MASTVDAIYENGVLKPTEPLPWKEASGCASPSATKRDLRDKQTAEIDRGRQPGFPSLNV
jgi:predicted DNA-binding antitoxin AbrB/MazE fold protein